MPHQSPNHSVAPDALICPNPRATAQPVAQPEVPLCSPVPSVVNEFPKQEKSGAHNDLATLRANLKSLVIKNLLASPFLLRFYVDSVISNSPNSNAAKILARNYQKIMNRISMPNPKSCTHIKVTGVRCKSPALRGEQFCYFHQHAYRGVRRPPLSRLHPVAMIESQESIQASLMEVINGLLRNTLDAKRAELILRALHIAVKNARNVRFDSDVYPKVRDVPEYAEPETDNVDTVSHVGTGAIARPASTTVADIADEYLPAVAAVPYKPVDPRDPHFMERMEEGGRVLARQAAERQAAEARSAQIAVTAAGSAHVGTAAPGCPGRAATATSATVSAGKVPVGTAAPGCPDREATVTRTSSAEAQRLPHPSRLSKGGDSEAERLQRKPPLGVKVDAKATPGPQTRKNAARSAG